MTAEIEITSATVWDDGQVARWALLGNTARRVTAVFGCRQQQIIGHGRAPGDVPAVTDEQVVRHSALARSVGLEFLYVLCPGRPVPAHSGNRLDRSVRTSHERCSRRSAGCTPGPLPILQTAVTL